MKNTEAILAYYQIEHRIVGNFRGRKLSRILSFLSIYKIGGRGVFDGDTSKQSVKVFFMKSLKLNSTLL